MVMPKSDNPKTAFVVFRVDEKYRKRLKRAAKKRRMRTSAFIREALDVHLANVQS